MATFRDPTFPNHFLPKPHLIQDDDAITLQQRIFQGLTEQGLIGHKAKQGIAASPVLGAVNMCDRIRMKNASKDAWWCIAWPQFATINVMKSNSAHDTGSDVLNLNASTSYSIPVAMPSWEHLTCVWPQSRQCRSSKRVTWPTKVPTCR